MTPAASHGDELELAFWRRRAGVRFGQTRDDVLVERSLAVLHGGVRRALVITSGGCAALSLLDVVEEQVLSVDIQPAQNRLAELKVAAWRQVSFADFERLLCGDARPLIPALRGALSEEARADWDRRRIDLGPGLRHGLQNCGRIDGFLRNLRRLFFVAVHRRSFVERFLSLDDPARQRALYAERWDLRRWRTALGLAFHPLVLRFTFDRTAAAALPPEFSTFVRRRLEDWLTAGPARANPFLWQTFLGAYPPDAPSGRPVYLQRGTFEAARGHLGKITWRDGDAAETLAREAAGSFDFIALSNILERASPGRIAETLEAATRAAAPGAFLLLRTILPQRFGNLRGWWRLEEALKRAKAEDRGGVCRPALLLRRRARVRAGRKKCRTGRLQEGAGRGPPTATTSRGNRRAAGCRRLRGARGAPGGRNARVLGGDC